MRTLPCRRSQTRRSQLWVNVSGLAGFLGSTPKPSRPIAIFICPTYRLLNAIPGQAHKAGLFDSLYYLLLSSESNAYRDCSLCRRVRTARTWHFTSLVQREPSKYLAGIELDLRASPFSADLRSKMRSSQHPSRGPSWRSSSSVTRMCILSVTISLQSGTCSTMATSRYYLTGRRISSQMLGRLRRILPFFRDVRSGSRLRLLFLSSPEL